MLEKLPLSIALTVSTHTLFRKMSVSIKNVQLTVDCCYSGEPKICVPYSRFSQTHKILFVFLEICSFLLSLHFIMLSKIGYQWAQEDYI